MRGFRVLLSRALPPWLLLAVRRAFCWPARPLFPHFCSFALLGMREASAAMQRGARRMATALLLIVLACAVGGASAAPVETPAAAASSPEAARQSALQSSLRSLDFPFRFRGHLYTPAASAEEAAAAAAEGEGSIPVAGTIAYFNFAQAASKHHLRTSRQTPEDMPALRGVEPPVLDFRPIMGYWPSLSLHRRKHFYECGIAVGSARQPLRVVVDTALAKSWIMDAGMEMPLQQHQSMARFERQASSTFAARVPTARDDDLPTPHDASMFSGIVARDQAFLGPLAHPVWEFTLVTAMAGRQDAEPNSEAASATGLGLALPFLWEHSGVLGLGVKPRKGAERGAGAPATPRVLNYWQRLGLSKAAVQSLRAQAAKQAKSNVCGCGTAMIGRACWCSADARKDAHEFLAKLATSPSLIDEPVLQPSSWRRRLLHVESSAESAFLELDDGSDESPSSLRRPSASDAWLGAPMTLETLLRNEDLLRELGLEPAALGAMSDAEIDVIIDYAEAKRNEMAHAKSAPPSAVYENSTSPGEHRLQAIAQVAPKPVPHEQVVDHAAVPKHEKALEAIAATGSNDAAPVVAAKPAVVPPPVASRFAPTAAAAPAPAPATATPTPIVTPKSVANAPAPASKPKSKGSSPRSIRVKSSDVSSSSGLSSAPSLMEMSSLASFYFSPSASSSASNAEDDPLEDGCFIPGHIDARFYRGGIHWIAADHTHASWSIGISDVLIDGVSTDLCSKANTGGAGCIGALSTGSTQIRGSQRIMMPLMEALPVDPNCVGSSLPRTLTIVLSNGMKVDLTDEDRRDRQRAEDDGSSVRSEDDSCSSVLALDTQRINSVVASAPGVPEVLSLGTPFLRKFYSVFDLESSRIGLARPRHDWFALNGCAWEGVGLSTPALDDALAQSRPKESWCAPIRSDQCPSGRNPFEQDANAAESTEWAGTGAKRSAVSAATASLASRSARFAAKSKSDAENPQLTLAKVLTGEAFFHGRDAERQREARQRQARRNKNARAKRRADNQSGRRYRKPAAVAHNQSNKKSVATPQARAKAAALRDWTQPLRAPRVVPSSRSRARRPPASALAGAHIFPAKAVPLHPRRRVLPHVIRSSSSAAVRATSALHEMVLSAEEKRLAGEAEKLLKAEALKHPGASGSGQAPAAMIPALTPANHRVGATPRSVLRAAGMDPRATRTTPEGLPAALPRFVARDPFDLNGYGVDDILPQQGMESMARSAVDDTIGEALRSIREMEATIPEQAQTAQQQNYQARMDEVVAAAQERVDNTEEDRAVREAESRAMQGLLQRAGDQALLESPTVASAPAASAPASSAAARLQQVKQIMRSMQHARAMRSGAAPQGSRHPVPATASHTPAAHPAQHQPDDTAKQFMPAWKRMLFRN